MSSCACCKHLAIAGAIVLGAAMTAAQDPNAVLYTPTNRVSDQAFMDYDQRSIEARLSLATLEGLETAKGTYQFGANSGSTAELTITNGALRSLVPMGTKITGTTTTGQSVDGVVVQEPGLAGDTKLFVRYDPPPINSNGPLCTPRATPPDLDACFVQSGTIEAEGFGSYTYEYTPTTDNRPTLSFQKFSIDAGNAVLECKLPDCVYPALEFYRRYYTIGEYANEWISAAFEGRATVFDNDRDPYDFSSNGIGSLEARGEAVSTGIVTLNLWMRVIQSFYEAARTCDGELWDEGAAYYIGSVNLEDPSDQGHMLFALAQKHCIKFGTCLDNEGGIAKVNKDILREFRNGKSLIEENQCGRDLTRITASITRLMTIPLVQGLLRHTLEINKFRDTREKTAASALAYGAALIPIVDSCNTNWANVIALNSPLSTPGYPPINFDVVKDALERQYECMGITCEDVGGWVDIANPGQYLEGAEPCNYVAPPGPAPTSSGGSSTLSAEEEKDFSIGLEEQEKDLSIGLIIFFGGLGFILFIVLSVFFFDRVNKKRPAASGEKEFDSGAGGKEGDVAASDLALTEEPATEEKEIPEIA